jgi:hypothetical protein
VVANIRPKASTLNAKSTPGSNLNRMSLKGPSFSTNGFIEMTLKNRNTLPSNVQLSLRFGRFPVSRISKDATVGAKIANKGLYSMLR